MGKWLGKGLGSRSGFFRVSTFLLWEKTRYIAVISSANSHSSSSRIGINHFAERLVPCCSCSSTSSWFFVFDRLLLLVFIGATQLTWEKIIGLKIQESLVCDKGSIGTKVNRTKPVASEQVLPLHCQLALLSRSAIG